MRDLNILETQEVQGGILQAVGALVAIFVLPMILNDHRKEYGQWGENMSQEYWDNVYPYDPNSNGCYGPSC